MAELGLAIVGVTATGTALAKKLYRLHRSARDRFHDAKHIATHVELLKCVLLELKSTVAEADGMKSENYVTTAQGLVTACEDIFNRVENLIAPCLLENGGRPSIANRFSAFTWHFKKDDIRLLMAQMDSIKSTLQLMVSIIALAGNLSQTSPQEDGNSISATRLKSGICCASQLVAGQRRSMTNLLVVEEHAITPSPTDGQHESNMCIPFARIHSWLSDVVGLSDSGTDPSVARSAASATGSVALSDWQKSLAGVEGHDIEMLLDKWTTLGEIMSNAFESIDGQSTISFSGSRNTLRAIQPSESAHRHISTSGSISGHNSADERTRSNTNQEANQMSLFDQEQLKIDMDAKEDTHVEQKRLASGSLGNPWKFEAETLQSRLGDRKCASDRQEATASVVPAPETSAHEAKTCMLKVRTHAICDQEIGKKGPTPNGTHGEREESEETFTIRSLSEVTPSRVEGSQSPVLLMESKETSFFRIESWVLSQKPNSENLQSDTQNKLNSTRTSDSFPFSGTTGRTSLISSAMSAVSASGSHDAEPTISDRPNHSIQSGNILHGPFSDISILESLASRSPSVISSIGTVQTASVPRQLGNMIKLANKLASQKHYIAAQSLYQKAYRMLEQDTSQRAEVEFRLGVVHGELGKYDKAEAFLKKALSRQMEIGADSKATLLTKHYLGRLFSRRGRWRDAHQIYQSLWETRSLLIYQSSAHSSALDLATRTGCEYGHVLLENRLYDKAIRVLQVCRPVAQRLRGEEDVKVTLRISLQLARALREIEESAESKALIQDVLSKCSGSSGGTALLRVDCTHELALLALREGNLDEAERLSRTSMQERAYQKGSDHAHTIESAHCLAQSLRSLGRLEDAREILDTIIARAVGTLGYTDRRFRRMQLDLVDILLQLNKEKDAEAVLDSALPGCLNQDLGANAEALKILEHLASLRLRDAQNTIKPRERQAKMSRALVVYKKVYPAQKNTLGAESTTTLQSGHDYGCLCSELRQHVTAEAILSEVWSGRKHVLGEEDTHSMETGLQLGLAYLWQQKHDDAMATLRSVHGSCGASIRLHSLYGIESAELMGYVQLRLGMQTEEAQRLLHSAFEARKREFGLVKDTFVSCLRLGVMATASKKFAEARQHFTWVFRNANQSDVLLSIGSGLLAGALAFIQGDRRGGNQLLQQGVQYLTKVEGPLGSNTENLAFTHAGLLLIQREGRQSVAILRQIFNTRRHKLGAKNKSTLAAANILGFAMITDSFLSTGSISDTVNKIEDWLFAQRQKTTFLTKACTGLSLAFAMSGKDFGELPKILLQWAYRSQRRHFGRICLESLTILAIMHSLNAAKLYNRIKRKSKSRGPKGDVLLRQVAPHMWDLVVAGIEDKIRNGEAPIDQENTWTARIAKKFAKDALWNSFEKYLRPAHVHIPTSTDSQTPGGRAWTIDGDVSEPELESLNVPKYSEPVKDTFSNFSEIFSGEDTADLQSLGASIINFTILSDGDMTETEEKLDAVQRRLIDEVISEADIDAAKSNVDGFEQEAGVDR